jgi:hypothetical protein
MQLTVVLGANSEASFDILLNDNSFVRKWIKELSWCLDNCSINQVEAFAGLLTLDESASHLTEACSTINKYLKNFIEIRSDIISQPQDYFNYLHLKFEQLSGEFNKPTRLFSIANTELKTAIRNLNFFLHRIETRSKNQQNLYISFNKDQYRRIPLEKEDYQFFDVNLPPGTFYLHYVELGKEFLDLYEDNLPLDYENTKNLHYYSGESYISLNGYESFANINFLNWLRIHNIDPDNKLLGYSRIPLGKVDNVSEVYSKIMKYRHIKKILIKE